MMLIPLPSETAVTIDSVLPSSKATCSFARGILLFSSNFWISILVPEVSSRLINGYFRDSWSLTVFWWAKGWLHDVISTNSSSPICMYSYFSSKPLMVPTAAKSASLDCKLAKLVRLSWALILNFISG